MQIEPYLFFNGRCEEAIAFYHQAIGAETSILMRYKDSPEPTPPGMLPPGFEDKIMHATLKVSTATLMVSDGMSEDQVGFQGFSLSLSPTDETEAQRLFAALSSGGQVQMPSRPSPPVPASKCRSPTCSGATATAFLLTRSVTTGPSLRISATSARMKCSRR